MAVHVDQPGKKQAPQPDLGYRDHGVGAVTRADPLGGVARHDRSDEDDGVPLHLDHPGDQDPPGAVAGHHGVGQVSDPAGRPVRHQGC